MDKAQEALDELKKDFDIWFESNGENIATGINIVQNNPEERMKMMEQITKSAFTEGAMRALDNLKKRL